MQTIIRVQQQEAQLTNCIMRCQQLPSGEWLQFTGLFFRPFPTPLPFDAFNEGDPLELSGSYLVREN